MTDILLQLPREPHWYKAGGLDTASGVQVTGFSFLLFSERAMRPPEQTGNILLDAVALIWGSLVALVQYADIEAVNQGAGIIVAALTAVLLLYRIYLAHEEATSSESQ